MFFIRESPKVEKPVAIQDIKLPQAGVSGKTLIDAVMSCAGWDCLQRMYLRKNVIYYTIGRRSTNANENCVICLKGNYKDHEIEPETTYTAVSVASTQWPGTVINVEPNDDDIIKSINQFARQIENAINTMTGELLFRKFK